MVVRAAAGHPIDESTERCLAVLAHDLAGPLTALRGFSDLLEPDVPAATRARASQGIRTATDRIDALLQVLREIAAVGAGPSALDCAPVRLRDVVADACRRVGFAQDVQLDIDVRDTVVVGDRQRLAGALEQLVIDAARHSPAGAAVRIVGRGSGSTAQVRVLDRGCARGSADSLGLRLAAAVARAHGGELSHGIPPGGGTERVLDLPVWGP